MAKVMIDIPGRYIDAVKGLMMMQADSEQEAQKTERAADMLKQATEPIMIDTTDAGIFAGDDKSRKQLYMAVGAFAFAQVIKDMEGLTDGKSSSIDIPDEREERSHHHLQYGGGIKRAAG